MHTRVLLLLPPLLAWMAGVTLLAASFLAWGAAGNTDLPDWLTTFGGVMFALPAIVASYACLRILLRLTEESFFVSGPQVSIGTILFLILIAWETALALSVGDSDSYEGLVIEGGASLSAPELLIVIFLVTGLKSFFAAAAVYLYAGAVTAEYARDSRHGEEDGIAELIREREEGIAPVAAEPRVLFARPPNDQR